MGSAPPTTTRNFRRTPACILTACIATALTAAEAPKVKFANERPKLRTLFTQPHEEGVERNIFNAGGEVTVQKSPPKAPKKSAKESGFNPDPGGVTPDPRASWLQPAATDALSQTTAGAYGSLFPESSYPDTEAQPLVPESLELPRRNVEGQTPIRRACSISIVPMCRFS